MIFRACITIKIKGKLVAFRHQFVYDGPGDLTHCIHCQNRWETRAEAEKQFEAEKRWKEVSESIVWPKVLGLPELN